eukprot:g33032.t1
MKRHGKEAFYMQHEQVNFKPRYTRDIIRLEVSIHEQKRRRNKSTSEEIRQKKGKAIVRQKQSRKQNARPDQRPRTVTVRRMSHVISVSAP